MARVTLEQWRALVAVVDAGSYAAAADRLHKSQSSVTHAVQRIADQLDVTVFRREGRRSMLTESGQVLVRRARQLLDEAGRLERLDPDRPASPRRDTPRLRYGPIPTRAPAVDRSR